MATLRPQELAQDELKNPAVPEVALLFGSVDSGDHSELLIGSADRQLARNSFISGEAVDREELATGQP
jgi:hypothetical protein